MTTPNATDAARVTFVLSKPERDYLRDQIAGEADSGGTLAGSLDALREHRHQLEAIFSLLDQIGWTREEDPLDLPADTVTLDGGGEALEDWLRWNLEQATEYVDDCRFHRDRVAQEDDPDVRPDGMTQEEGVAYYGAVLRAAERELEMANSILVTVGIAVEDAKQAA